jgi:hypothetical protein
MVKLKVSNLSLSVRFCHPAPNRGAMPMSDDPYSVMHKRAKNTKTNGRVQVSSFRPEDCRPKVARHKVLCLGTKSIVENVRERIYQS